MKRLLGRIAALLAALIVLAIVGTWWFLARSVPPLSGRAMLPGLSFSARVLFDSLAIPHIVAQSDVDAFRVLGYLHARERLWAMEVLRRGAEGRIAEALGERALDTDRFLRSLDIPRAARRSVALLGPEARAILESYVAGINAWLTHPTRPLPPEYQVLRLKAEPWSIQQVFEVSRLMSWDLSNASAELELARTQSRLGERVRDMFPWVPDTGVVILPRGSGRWSNTHRPRPSGNERGRAAALPSARLREAEVPRIPELAAAILDASAMSHASNSWVIGPARTHSGKPILANDPHLTLRAPALWYLVAIESPGFTVTGATIPGLPAVVIGRNRRIAWGLTNIEADDIDYVIERLSADSSRVQTPSGWVPVEAVRDSIPVRGRRAVPFVLRRTPNGPLIGGSQAAGVGLDSGGTVRALAMRWVGHEPSDELTALLAVDRAGSWDAFLRALEGWKSPEESWVYADVDGNIGYTASGRIPVRRSGRGLLPTPGWTGEGAWERFLDFAELPRTLNPPEGFIVTANNRVIGPEYPYFLTASPALPYRAERIRELVQAKGGITLEDVRRMQMDTVDLFARWAKVIAARAAEASGRSDVAAALRAWDGTAGTDRTEPTIFYAWYRALQRLTYEGKSPGYMPNSPLHRWLLEGGGRWFDDPRTSEQEDLAALSRRAMQGALGVAGGRRWGEVHKTVSRHALGGVRALDALLGLNVGPSPRAGSLYTVDVADFGQFVPPFINTHGPSLRQVVDLADPEGGALIITSGESGNPFSRHYRDQRDRWWKGELWTVPLSAARVAGASTLRLEPGP